MLKDADSAVRQMDFEAKTLPNRDALMSQVNDYRSRLSSMRRKCNPIITGAEDARSALLGDRGGGAALNQDNRNRLMTTTHTLLTVPGEESLALAFTSHGSEEEVARVTPHVLDRDGSSW